MLEQFELSVGSLREDRGREGFHNLLDCDSLTSQLVLCRATKAVSILMACV